MTNNNSTNTPILAINTPIMATNTPIRAIIFDLDNTLIDFMKMKRLSCEEAVSAMIDAGLQIKKEDALKKLFELYDKYGIEYKDIFQVFLQENTGKIDYKILSNGIIAYRRIKNSFLAPYPHVANTLLELKKRNLKLAIVSDAPKLRAWLRLAAMRLTNFFDVVVTFDDTGERKPNKLPFEAAILQLKQLKDMQDLAPEQVLMVGDWPERDIKGAKTLGLKTCFAKYGYSFGVAPKTEAEHEIEDIEELLGIV